MFPFGSGSLALACAVLVVAGRGPDEAITSPLIHGAVATSVAGGCGPLGEDLGYAGGSPRLAVIVV
jgi:hypothetical protein